ncbi:MAG TPA: cupin domain-containing protein [Ectothiorhodospiraceae bacterium]|nr:cupin domain-containing protein [Ectothiorhodospiraceae bacterium]
MRTRYNDITAFTTKDGSTIRELMHPNEHKVSKQSLAEAIVPVGTATRLHHHHKSEELYHITAGNGVMQLGEEQFTVAVGDTILIPPGTPHAIENSGHEALSILCCCAPPYSHDDTELL